MQPVDNCDIREFSIDYLFITVFGGNVDEINDIANYKPRDVLYVSRKEQIETNENLLAYPGHLRSEHWQ